MKANLILEKNINNTLFQHGATNLIRMRWSWVEPMWLTKWSFPAIISIHGNCTTVGSIDGYKAVSIASDRNGAVSIAIHYNDIVPFAPAPPNSH